MKANDLRIGNWFIQYDEPEQFDGDFYHLSDIKFIPLTEEWLLNLGFEYNNNYDNYVIRARDYYNSVGWNDEDCEWYYNNDSSDAGCYYVTSIKYVHELQNLYFAINQQELV